MYTAVFQIPLFQPARRQVVMPRGLARDVLTQWRHEPNLRLVCPRAAGEAAVADPMTVDLDAHPGLGVSLLPWDGMRRTWPSAFRTVRAALRREAAEAAVWHTGCSRRLWDLCSVGYDAGKATARGVRVFCLDSDPAEMVRRSGWRGRLKAPLVERALAKRVADADATIFIGEGAARNYGGGAKRAITVNAVWLSSEDLADPSDVHGRFAGVVAGTEPARLALPTRMTAWKGVDDAIEAAALLKREPVRPWTLDIIGEGAELPKLRALAEKLDLASHVRFLPPAPYGPPFFELLRSYHAVLAPTRALEEARIVYDAAASGCVLVHSATPTLEAALANLQPRWSHEPGNPRSLVGALRAALASVERWPEAARNGIASMSGRTIDEMHRARSAFIAGLKAGVKR